MLIIIHTYNIDISSLSIFSYHIPSDSLNQTKQANKLRIPPSPKWNTFCWACYF